MRIFVKKLRGKADSCLRPIEVRRIEAIVREGVPAAVRR